MFSMMWARLLWTNSIGQILPGGGIVFIFSRSAWNVPLFSFRIGTNHVFTVRTVKWFWLPIIMSAIRKGHTAKCKFLSNFWLKSHFFSKNVRLSVSINQYYFSLRHGWRHHLHKLALSCVEYIIICLSYPIGIIQRTTLLQVFMRPQSTSMPRSNLWQPVRWGFVYIKDNTKHNQTWFK